MGNYVIAGVGNYVIVNPSNLGNYVIADTRPAAARRADLVDANIHVPPHAITWKNNTKALPTIRYWTTPTDLIARGSRSLARSDLWIRPAAPAGQATPNRPP
jgi:hypothetical protein